jgi:hypothetical protein
LLQGAWFISFNRGFPYYRIWDMDLAVAQDTLWIHSDKYPHVLGHPAFGMYLVLALSQKVAFWCNALSVLSLDDLRGCLDPLGAMAEFTDYIRHHSPLFALAIPFFLWLALLKICRPGRAWSLLLLVFLGTQHSLVYHASMVRSELYSVLFWALAVWIMSLAIATARPVLGALCLTLAGLFLGLSFLTKVQALIYLAACPPLLFLGTSVATVPPYTRDPALLSRASHVLFISLGLLDLVFFCGCLAAASRTVIPEDIWTSAVGDYSVQPIAYLLLLVLAVLVVAHSIIAIRGRESVSAFRISAALVLILTGFLASFLTHMFVFSSTSRSLEYMLYDFKVLFMRPRFYQIRTLRDCLGMLLNHARDLPALFLVHVTALLLLIGAPIGGSRSRRPWALLLSSLAMLDVGAGTRLIPRDIIWVEILLNFLTVAYLTIVFQGALRYRAPIRVAIVSLMMLLLFTNRGLDASMEAAAGHVEYRRGYDDQRWITRSWTHREYETLMADRYDPTRIGSEAMREARQHAARHVAIRDVASFVFPTRAITHRNIGVLADGFPVWSDALEWRVVSFPARLGGAIVVDALPIPPRMDLHVQYARGFVPTDWLRGLLERPLAEDLTVVPRRDLELVAFVAEDDFRQMSKDQRARNAETVVLSNGRRSKDLYGVRIDDVRRLSPESGWSHRCFFVIRETLWTPATLP